MVNPSVRDLSGRVALLVTGAGLAAYGYLVTALTDLGNGPLFAVQDGLQRRLGWSMGVTATVLGLVIVVVAALLRAPLGAGTFALPALTGWWIDALEHHVVTVHGLPGRWLLFLGGTAVMMLGGVLCFTSALGVSALDGVMLGLAGRLGVAPARTRVGMEIGMACTGALLGGRVGVGTVVMGATVGHLFAFWRRVLDRFVRSASSALVDGSTRGDAEGGTDDDGLFPSRRRYPAPELSTITPRTTSATPATFDPVSDSS